MTVSFTAFCCRRLASTLSALLLAFFVGDAAALTCVQNGYLPNEPNLQDVAVQCQPYTTTRILYGGPVGWSFPSWPCSGEDEAEVRQCLIQFMSTFRSCFQRTEQGNWVNGSWGDAGSTPEGALNFRPDNQPFKTYFSNLIYHAGSPPTCGTGDGGYVEWGMFRYHYAYCPLGKTFYGRNYADPGGPMFCADITSVASTCANGDYLSFGNPVNIATGAKLHQETHLSGGESSVPLTWYYRSDRQHHVSATKAALPSPARGIQAHADRVWRHSLDKRLYIDRTGYRPAVRIIQPGAARDAYFALTASGWVPSQFGKDRLRESTSVPVTWTYVSVNNVAETYDAEGKLVSITWPSGKQIVLSYTGGLLREARNSFGVPIRFNYTNGELSSVHDAAGRVWSYSFAPFAKTLVRASFPDSTHREFLYETRHAHLLSGVVDERGTRVGTYTYNEGSERVTVTERALSADRYAFTYRDPYTGPSHPRVTTPLGGTAQTSWEAIGPHLLYGWYLPVAEFFAGVDARHAGCEGLPRSSWADQNGNRIGKVDFNNNKVCYAYDLSRNLETKRAEGLSSSADCNAALSSPPTGARVISTQWHPDWRLETRIAEPKKLTTITYNGQGATCAPSTVLVDGKPPAVICTRTEQATTDETGAAGFAATVTGTASTWRYTYTTYGRVLTATDPNNRTTTTSYHPDNDADLGKRGNVASITNAANHTTYITDYNPHGQPTRIVDPNGVVTVLTYDPRMRLTGRTVGNEATVFGYDPVGQMTQCQPARWGTADLHLRRRASTNGDQRSQRQPD